ncbi:hypothetical protein [Streptomyces sp. OE57]|uniref:hypothetical protein n=1 Tax=Streptomyces lacaronensis TaxID=3379885 RepID=UPI0039B750C6
MLIEGAEVPEATVFYVIFQDGSTGLIETTSGEEPLLSKPGRLVTAEEYETARADIQAAVESSRAAILQAETAAAQAAYGELRTAGLSDAVARTLSGYQGPEPTGG